MRLDDLDHKGSMLRSSSMSELDRLHANVLANPEADEPRVVYADEVERSDPARAELVRVQLQSARSRRAQQSPGVRADWYTRESVLLERHKDAWARPVTEIHGVRFVKFYRGFLEHVRMSARDFLAHGETLYQRAPVLHLDLEDLRPLADEVFQSPLLARIHSMRLWRNRLGDREISLLAASPHLGRLRWIDLTYNDIGTAGVEALCASANLPSLRYVDLADNPAPDPTPQIGETDTLSNDIMHVDVPMVARDLEQRFGKKAWLSGPFGTAIFPPQRDMF
jgi:uncharacterized protein (TIGR02996 family)